MAEPKVYQPWKPKREAWAVPDYDERVVYAVRALEQGNASEPQQRIIWRWLMYVTEHGGMQYRPGGAEAERETTFALGKAFVGQQLQKMLHPELTPADDGNSTRKQTR